MDNIYQPNGQPYPLTQGYNIAIAKEKDCILQTDVDGFLFELHFKGKIIVVYSGRAYNPATHRLAALRQEAVYSRNMPCTVLKQHLNSIAAKRKR